MRWLLDSNIAQFLIFITVLGRTSGLVITAPIVGATQIPVQARALLAVALAVVLTPSQWGARFEMPATTIDFAIVMSLELGLGLVLGLGMTIVLAGLQLAGQLIGQLTGMSLAEVFDPTVDSMPLLSQLLQMFSLAIFVTIGGHRLLVAGLLETFTVMPPGHAMISSSLLDTLMELVAMSFGLGIRAAAPAIVALLLATLVMGLLSRTLPQLNVISFGFGLSALTGFAALIVSLGSIAWVFQEESQAGLERLIAGIFGG